MRKVILLIGCLFVASVILADTDNSPKLGKVVQKSPEQIYPKLGKAVQTSLDRKKIYVSGKIITDNHYSTISALYEEPPTRSSVDQTAKQTTTTKVKSTQTVQAVNTAKVTTKQSTEQQAETTVVPTSNISISEIQPYLNELQKLSWNRSILAKTYRTAIEQINALDNATQAKEYLGNIHTVLDFAFKKRGYKEHIEQMLSTSISQMGKSEYQAFLEVNKRLKK